MKRKIFDILSISIVFVFILFSCDQNKNCVQNANVEFNRYSLFLTQDEKYGVCNADFSIIIPAEYDDIELYNNYIYGEKYNKDTDVTTRYVFDLEGKVIFSYEMSYVLRAFNSDNMIYFDNNVSCGFYDVNGNVVMQVENGYFSGTFNDGFVLYYNSEKNVLNYVDCNFNKLKIGRFDLKIKSGNSFYNGYAIVELENNNYAVIDTKGNILLKKKFNSMGDKVLYKNIVVSKNIDDKNVFGLLNLSGKYILNCEYDDIIQLSETVNLCLKDSFWYLINTSEKESYKICNTDICFDRYSVFENKIVFYKQDSDGTKKYGIMNTTGIFLLDAEYDKIIYGYNNIWNVKNNGQWYIYTSDDTLNLLF